PFLARLRSLHSFPTRRSSDLNVPTVSVLVLWLSSGSLYPFYSQHAVTSTPVLTSPSHVNGHRCFILLQTCTRCLKAITGTTSNRSEEHTSELQSRFDLVCRLL